MIKKLLSKFASPDPRVVEMAKKFDELQSFVFEEGAFVDSRGKSESPHYNSIEVSVKWARFHRIVKEFHEIRGKR